MGHKHRSSTLDVSAFVRGERQNPWRLVLDLLLFVGMLTWVTLRATAAPHPQAFALYSAVLVGAIVHRVFTVMGRPTD